MAKNLDICYEENFNIPNDTFVFLPQNTIKDLRQLIADTHEEIKASQIMIAHKFHGYKILSNKCLLSNICLAKTEKKEQVFLLVVPKKKCHKKKFGEDFSYEKLSSLFYDEPEYLLDPTGYEGQMYNADTNIQESDISDTSQNMVSDKKKTKMEHLQVLKSAKCMKEKSNKKEKMTGRPQKKGQQGYKLFDNSSYRIEKILNQSIRLSRKN